MKKVLVAILIVSIIACLISVVATFRARQSYEESISESAVLMQAGQYDYYSFYDDLNRMLKKEKTIKMLYIFDAICGAVILGDCVGLMIISRKSKNNG